MRLQTKNTTIQLLFISLLATAALFYYLYTQPEYFSDKKTSIPLDILSSHQDSEGLDDRNVIDEERSSTVVSSRKEFNPLKDELFVVSFIFNQETAPMYDRRQKLIAHYEADKKPYAGWAIALRRFTTSYRFEFYLRDKNGTGGWFSFDTIENIEKTKNYALSFVVSPDDYIFALVSELDKDMKATGRTQKLGGFPIQGIVEVEAESKLQITSGKPKIGPFRGEISSFSIFKLPQTVAEKSLIQSTKEGPRSLLVEYPNSCILSLTEGNNSCLYNQSNL